MQGAHRQVQTCHQGWNEDVMEDVPQHTGGTRSRLPWHFTSRNHGVHHVPPGTGDRLDRRDRTRRGDPFWEKPAPERDRCLGVMYHMSWRIRATWTGHRSTLRRGALFIESGCFGCHEIKGYTDLPADRARTREDSNIKTDPQWIFRWVRNPKGVQTRTPGCRTSASRTIRPKRSRVPRRCFRHALPLRSHTGHTPGGERRKGERTCGIRRVPGLPFDRGGRRRSGSFAAAAMIWPPS